MRCVAWCTAVLVVGVSSITFGQVHEFPYEAVVATDNAPIHSGPGYYATGQLKKGDRVRVHRHDPGGWFMIEPPAGEFSLVAAETIRATGPDTAEVVVEETSARVGSRLSGEFNVEQVPLTRGDRLQLVKAVAAPDGWVAIVPPRGEFRWVSGKYLVPLREDVRSQHDADPFAVPSSARRPATVEEDAITTAVADADPRPTRPAPLAGRTETPSAQTSRDDGTSALQLLDRELEGLALTEPTDWPLEELAAEYRRLSTTQVVSARQVDVRLAQLERMRMVRDRYADYVQLTSGTDERDAALVAQYSTPAAGRIVQAAKPVPPHSPVTLAAPVAEQPARTTIPQRVPSAPPAEPPSVNGAIANRKPPTMTATSLPPNAIPPARSPSPSGPVLLAPETADSRAVPSGPVQPQQNGATGGPQRFDAVGVIQKAVDPHPDAPKHVLVAPGGKILVYLQPKPGISLDQFVGQPMGVDGERLRHPELTPPMIVVERLTPVRQ